MDDYKRGEQPEGSAAALLRDQRLDYALGEGSQAREDKRKQKVARYQAELGPELEKELEMARTKIQMASTVDPKHPSTLFKALNQVLQKSGQPPIHTLPSAITMSPDLCALYKALLSGKLDPAQHSSILKKANIAQEYGEEDEDEDVDDEESDLGDDAEEDVHLDKVGAEKSSTLQHYIRIFKVERSKMGEWVERFPVDFMRLETILANSTETYISLVYVGACISNTPLGRMTDDARKGKAYSILKRFMQLGLEPECYEIKPLSLQLPRSGIDAWDCSPDTWAIEQSLIAAASLSLNSAYGGRFIDWTLQKDVEALVDKCIPYRPQRAQISPKFPLDLTGKVESLYDDARALAKDLKAIPISNGSLRTAAAEAAGGERLADMTTVGVNIAKDITFRDAFTDASWYGTVAGPAPRNYRLAQDIAMGLAVTPNVEATGGNESGDEVAAQEEVVAAAAIAEEDVEEEEQEVEEEQVEQGDVEEGIEEVDIGPPPAPHHPRYGRAFQNAQGWLHIYMAFVNFWAVCLRHTWVMIFYVILIRYLLILRPRILIVSSDKVSTILRLCPALPAGALVVPIRDLARLLPDPNTIEWKDTAGGDFFRLWVGKVVVVCIGQDETRHWSVMLVRFHNGYMAYRPAFQQVLYQMNVILALMSQVLTWLARRRPVWKEAVARQVAEEAEQLFDEICLTEALDSYREQLLRLQRAFLGLSGLRSRVYNDVIEEHEQALQKFLTRGAQMSATRTQTLANSLVAVGLPGSIEREEQVQRFSAAGPLSGLPCPASMIFGEDEWKCWLRTRRQGVVLVESARSLLTPIEVMREVATEARRSRSAKKSTTLFPGYHGDMTLEEIFMHLVNVDTFALDRQWSSSGIRMVTCTACGLRGFVSKPAGSHSCKLPDGIWGPSKNVVASDARLIITQLLLPIQLLVDDDYSEEIVKSKAICSVVDWGTSDIEATNELFPCTVAIRLDQAERTDALPFLQLQGHIVQHIDDMIYQKSAKATATAETTREFVRKFLHDTSPSSHMQDAYAYYARLRTLERRRAGEEVTDDQDDYPLDWKFKVQRRIT